MEKKICASCRHENSSNDYFCTQCGSKLVDKKSARARLRLIYGEPNGALFLLRRTKTTIGHDCGNIIVLGDELISNKHAAIVFENDHYWIEDRNSKNGVFVDGQKIVRKDVLTDGTLIKLGSTILQFEEIDDHEA